MGRLEAKELHLVIGDRVLIRDPINFVLEPGMRLAIVGPNGTGKTTLLETLAGYREIHARLDEPSGVQATGGTTYVAQDASEVPSGRSLMEVVLGARPRVAEVLRAYQELAERMTGSQEDSDRLVRLGDEIDRLDAWSWEARAKSFVFGLGFLETDLEKPLESLSGGQRHRGLLARALLEETEVLLMDEPTNHLDVRATAWLARTLTEGDRVLVFTSHDRYILERVPTHILDLSGQEASLYRGAYSSFTVQKAARLEERQESYERQMEERRRLEAYIRRYKAGNRATMAKSRENRLNRMEEIRMPEKEIRRKVVIPEAETKRTIKFHGLVCGYDRPLVGPYTDEIRPGERIALLGRNGEGKSTILKTLAGRLSPISGTVTGMDELEIAYFAQDFGDLPRSGTVLDAVFEEGLTNLEARSLLARWGFRGERLDVEIPKLSGGEKNRILLFLLCLSRPDLLILDEPTNHLDLDGRVALEEALSEFDGTVFLASHDRAFLDALSVRVLEVRDGQVFPLDLRALDGEGSRAVVKASGGPTIEEVSREIERLEREKSRLLDSLGKPGAGFSGREKEISRKLQRIDGDLGQLWKRYEALSH